MHFSSDTPWNRVTLNTKNEYNSRYFWQMYFKYLLLYKIYFYLLASIFSVLLCRVFGNRIRVPVCSEEGQIGLLDMVFQSPVEKAGDGWKNLIHRVWKTWPPSVQSVN